MRAIIIGVGTELLKGRMDDTNSTFLSKYLSNIGFNIVYRVNVKDNKNDIKSIIEIFKNRTDLFVFTGGLGPTDDDITLETVAEVLNKKLIFSKELWKNIESIFKRYNLPLYESNKKQAYTIEDAVILKNENGTASGYFYIEKDNTSPYYKKIFILLPGPPAENIPMVKEKLIKVLEGKKLISKKTIEITNIFKKEIRVYNYGESALFDLFREAEKEMDKNLDRSSFEINSYFSKNGYIEIIFKLKNFLSQINLSKSNLSEMKINFSKIVKKYISILNKNKIDFTENKDIELLVFDLLNKKGKTIAFAESITGGGLSKTLVNIPGASKVFTGSIVCYSNFIKESLLNVKSIKKYGAVSKEVAQQMVSGLKEKFNSDINVAVTGIAGPTGGSKEKPIGLVYFGFLFDDKLNIKKMVFKGDREKIINKTIMYAYLEIYKYLLNL